MKIQIEDNKIKNKSKELYFNIFNKTENLILKEELFIMKKNEDGKIFKYYKTENNSNLI